MSAPNATASHWTNVNVYAEHAVDEAQEGIHCSQGSAVGDRRGSVASIYRQSMLTSRHRPSFSVAGSRALLMSTSLASASNPLLQDHEHALEDEIDLLDHNNLIKIKRPSNTSHPWPIFLPSRTGSLDAGSGANIRVETDETTALLPPNDARVFSAVDREFAEAVSAGKIAGSWALEAITILRNALPLLVTLLLQYSFTFSSILIVGRLGTAELGAVSLASMTANITGYGIYQGLATALDTLGAQAYGSGLKTLVGMHMQRLTLILWIATIPIGVVWLNAGSILRLLIDNEDISHLAGLYLRIILLGCPGYAAFEGGKRFLQAQGIFHATLTVLVVFAAFNAAMCWLLVWRLEIGFIGGPIAVAITNTLLPIGLALHVRFFYHSALDCWTPINSQALKNWNTILKLAIPGLLMIEAEILGFEIITFGAGRFGEAVLASQAILVSLSAMAFYLPFAFSVAASTRVANLVGATLVDVAKMSAKVSVAYAGCAGLLNTTVMATFRYRIPQLFTDQKEVIDIVASVLPVCAAFQLLDALVAASNGLLRGLGRQAIGGYAQLFAYYVVALPISFGTAFGLHWGLLGLWSGVAIALLLVSVLEYAYLCTADWQKSVTDAMDRNALG